MKPRLEPGKRYAMRTDSVSNGVNSIAYDNGAHTLDVEFPSGQRYRYFDVPGQEFQALFAGGSIGARINQHIKPNYRVEKL